jgi:hypothetical protein
MSMQLKNIARCAAATVLLAVGTIVLTEPAGASTSSFTLDFPAGQACSFALHVSGTGGNSTTRHDANGLIVSGGTGAALTFSGNGDSVSLPSNGTATLTTTNPDGSSTVQLAGNNVLILFPTDNPAGPSTTLIVGRATLSIDAVGTFDVHSISGRQVDICAGLAS